MYFTKAIVRKPSQSLLNGITTVDLGVVNYELALEQHATYITTLKKCGLKVFELPPLKDYPDSTFVEDAALCTEKVAIILKPQVESRRGEEAEMSKVLTDFYKNIEFLKTDRAFAEGGDVLRVDNHFYIGVGKRTNRAGAGELKAILNNYGYTASLIQMREILHLKTGLSYLGNNNLVIGGELKHVDELRSFVRFEMIDSEEYAANMLRVNDNIIIPEGYPHVLSQVRSLGLQIYEVPMSEFQKVDGGLSCLSLRF